MNDKIIFEEIDNFFNNQKDFLINICNSFDGHNLTSQKDSRDIYFEKQIRKAHKLDDIIPLLGATKYEQIELGSLFTSDRTILKSIVFLYEGLSFGYLIKSKKWNRESEEISANFVLWNDIESVSINFSPDKENKNAEIIFLLKKSKQAFNISNTFLFSIDTNLNTERSLTLFVKLLNNIVNRIHTQQSETSNNFKNFVGEKMTPLIENKKYSEAYTILVSNSKYKSDLNYFFYKAELLFFLEKYDDASAIINAELSTALDENPEYLDLKLECLSAVNGNYDAINLLVEKIDIYKNNKRDYQKTIDRYYQKYLENFISVPYQERKVLLISNDSNYLKTANFVVIKQDKLPKISFPLNHPKNDELYVGHPFNPSIYLPILEYDYELLNDRISELCYLLQCLGATYIEIRNDKSTTNYTQQDNFISTENGLKGKVVTANADYSNTSNSNNTLGNIIKIARTQKLTPHNTPFIPNGLIWYQSEPSWQRLVHQRLSGSLIEHEETIYSKTTQVLNNEDIKNITLEIGNYVNALKSKVDKTGIEKLNNQADSQWTVIVHFKPLQEFNTYEISAQEITFTSNKTITESSKSVSDCEQEYLKEVQFMLEDDNQIDEKEKSILNRFRVKYGLSEDRAFELENSIKKNQQNDLNSEELEYLGELNNILEGEKTIDTKSRRLLDRFSVLLGIGKDRVVVLEKIYLSENYNTLKISSNSLDSKL